MAQRLGFHRLMVEIDSNFSVTLLQAPGISQGYAFGNLLSGCHQLLAGFEHVVVRHIWREGNRSADCLAWHRTLVWG